MSVKATVEPDGSAILYLDGVAHKIGGKNIESTRERIRQLVTEYAAQTGQPQTLQAHDATGSWETVIHPDGRTETVNTDRVDDPATAPLAPEPVLGNPHEEIDPEQWTTNAIVPTRRPRHTSRLVIAGAAVLLLLGAGTAALTLTTQPAPVDSPTAPSHASLWTVPENITALTAAGDVVAGTDNGSFVLFEGKTGQRLTLETQMALADAAAVKATAGDGLTVISTSETSGVAVVDGTVHLYEGKGAVLDRGPVPALVGGTPQAKTFWVFKNGKPAQVQPPEAGNSLFGGLPGGGSAWAAAGGKVTYVPATGTPRTVTLVPPVPGAAVSSWLSVTESQAVILWKSGNNRVLAAHNTSETGKGTIATKTVLGAEDTVTPTAGLTVLRQNGNSGIYPNTDKDIRCPAPVVTAKELWCPGADSQWRAFSGSAKGRPAAAGTGFALILQDGHTQVIATDLPTDQHD